MIVKSNFVSPWVGFSVEVGTRVGLRVGSGVGDGTGSAMSYERKR